MLTRNLIQYPSSKRRKRSKSQDILVSNLEAILTNLEDVLLDLQRMSGVSEDSRFQVTTCIREINRNRVTDIDH